MRQPLRSPTVLPCGLRRRPRANTAAGVPPPLPIAAGRDRQRSTSSLHHRLRCMCSPFSPPRSTPPSLLHGWRGGALPLSALGAAQRRYVAGHLGLESSAGGTTSRGAGVPACAAAEQPPSTSERAAVRKAGQRRPELLRCGLQAALCVCRVGLLRAHPTLNGTTGPYLGRATARGRARHITVGVSAGLAQPAVERATPRLGPGRAAPMDIYIDTPRLHKKYIGLYVYIYVYIFVYIFSPWVIKIYICLYICFYKFVFHGSNSPPSSQLLQLLFIYLFFIQAAFIKIIIAV
jgi:hypothetical protein